jgi:hypothetical protein
VRLPDPASLLSGAFSLVLLILTALLWVLGILAVISFLR